MTGHLEGLGPEGSLREANDKIREFCHQNGKILFDFADIERYDPDGETDYQLYNANDACIYHSQAGQQNWAAEWLENNPDHLLAKISTKCSSCAHSVSLNCVMKGFAAWHLWARLAGWQGITSAEPREYANSDVEISPNPADNILKIRHNIAANSIDYEICDICARVMIEGEIDQGNTKSIDISELAAGMYFVRIKSEAMIRMNSFIKLK
jgi:hypothetical protein